MKQFYSLLPWPRLATLLLFTLLLVACTSPNVPVTGATQPAGGSQPNAANDPYAAQPNPNTNAAAPSATPVGAAAQPQAPAAPATTAAATATTQAVAQPAPTNTIAAQAPAPTNTTAAQAPAPTATLQAAAPAQPGPRTELTTPYRLMPLLDLDIQSADGQFVGKVNNLIVGRDGTIRYVIFEVNELLGMGEKKTIIPWSAFKPYTAQQNAFVQNALVLNVTPEALRNAPPVTVDEDQINLTIANWDQPILTYWQSQNVAVPASAPAVLLDGDGGYDVNSSQAIDLGSIEDLIVDSAGTIRFAVLEPDEDLLLGGLGPHYIPIPWRSLTWVSKDDFALNVTPAQLAQAPFFDVWETTDITGSLDSTWNAFWP